MPASGGPSQWTGWEQYDRFFSQMVRWSMRPTGDTGKFTVATDVEGGKTRVIVSALNKEDEFLNYQAMDGTVLAPDMQSVPLKMEQAAPGRYVGEFESGKPGSYLISIRAGKTMIRTGVNIGYSNEFRDRETNTPLLKSIAELPAKKGEPGKLMPPLPEVPADGEKAEEKLKPQLAVDPYRRDLPQAVVAAGYLAMAGAGGELRVFWRMCSSAGCKLIYNGSFPFGRGSWILCCDASGRSRRRKRWSRLRSRKAEVDRSIESRRAAARFEPDAAMPVDPNAIEAAEARPTSSGDAGSAGDQAGCRRRKTDDIYVAAAEGQETSLAGSGAGSRV